MNSYPKNGICQLLNVQMEEFQDYLRYEVYSENKKTIEFVIESKLSIPTILNLISKWTGVPIPKMTFAKSKTTALIFLNTPINGRCQCASSDCVRTVMLTDRNKEMIRLTDLYSCHVPLQKESSEESTEDEFREITDSFESVVIALENVYEMNLTDIRNQELITFEDICKEVKAVIASHHYNLSPADSRYFFEQVLYPSNLPQMRQHTRYLDDTEIIALIIHTNFSYWMSLSFTKEYAIKYPYLTSKRNLAFRKIVQNQHCDFQFSIFLTNVHKREVFLEREVLLKRVQSREKIVCCADKRHSVGKKKKMNVMKVVEEEEEEEEEEVVSPLMEVKGLEDVKSSSPKSGVSQVLSPVLSPSASVVSPKSPGQLLDPVPITSVKLATFDNMSEIYSENKSVKSFSFFIYENVKQNLPRKLELPKPLRNWIRMHMDCNPQVVEKAVVQMCVKALQQAYSFARSFGHMEKFNDKTILWATRMFGNHVQIRMFWNDEENQYFLKDLKDILVRRGPRKKPDPVRFDLKQKVVFDKDDFKAHNFEAWYLCKGKELEFMRSMLRSRHRDGIHCLPYHYFDKHKGTFDSTLDVIVLLSDHRKSKYRAAFTKQEHGKIVVKHFYNLSKPKKALKHIASVYAASSFALFAQQSASIV